MSDTIDEHAQPHGVGGHAETEFLSGHSFSLCVLHSTDHSPSTHSAMNRQHKWPLDPLVVSDEVVTIDSQEINTPWPRGRSTAMLQSSQQANNYRIFSSCKSHEILNGHADFFLLGRLT